MARKAVKARGEAAPALLTVPETDSEAEIGGVRGPGPWMVARFTPVSLFSLKASFASSGVGRTLVVPTPYSVKMALLDAGLSTGLIPNESGADGFVRAMRGAEVRIGPPDRAVATHTIVKIRQEPKGKTEGVAYTSSVAYREFVHFRGDLSFAFDLRTLDKRSAELTCALAPAIRSIGKRGGFIQFLGMERHEELGRRFTVPLESWESAADACHLAWLDDFGPEATFDILNSYSDKSIKRDKHRKFVQTVVPLGRRSAGPGFTDYSAGMDRS